MITPIENRVIVIVIGLAVFPFPISFFMFWDLAFSLIIAIAFMQVAILFALIALNALAVFDLYHKDGYVSKMKRLIS